MSTREVQVSAQTRSVAVVITVTGQLEETNVEPVLHRLRPFTTLGDRLILTIRADGDRLPAVVSAFGLECAWQGVDWILVDPRDRSRFADIDYVLRAESIEKALQHFITAIHDRRHMPLPR